MITVICTFFIMRGQTKELYREVGRLYVPTAVIYKDTQVEGAGDWIVYFDALADAAKTRRVPSNSCLFTKELK